MMSADAAASLSLTGIGLQRAQGRKAARAGHGRVSGLGRARYGRCDSRGRLAPRRCAPTASRIGLNGTRRSRWRAC